MNPYDESAGDGFGIALACAAGLLGMVALAVGILVGAAALFGG
ncbi:hypothetical protein GCM10023144_01460 [Pigmentiphaga soli]|uniref:Uncharacterized protein n=1 Tax=Pigmentiphaga soli TaxID=1007095 RepID=A0ABP8GCQ6_9BURK